ncbi:hypothetical protein O181_016849 [Austropuccinia psidii MF-1]|uniref:Uncharacterized protein n=1 Tax=Austropuccinia psidii MF-1 TaxID=1389203 RepID=A0A9Q3C2I1_9BASI|nr:hypothetical protein [Austropuccinia psidii MF-1]
MDQFYQLHQLLKALFQWREESKRFNLATHWEELGEGFQKIFLKDKHFKDLMLITKLWNPNRKFKLPVERETSIREKKATIQAIEENLKHKGYNLIPSGSQLVNQSDFPVASHHS